MAPLIAAGLIEAGSSIINGMIQNHQVNNQNAYNSPASQMGRFQQAGLNPNLIYSEGNAGNMASAAYQSPTPNVDFGKGISGMMNMLSTYQNIKQSQAGIENTNKDTALKDSQIAQTQANTRNAATQNDVMLTQMRYQTLQSQILQSDLNYRDKQNALRTAAMFLQNELTSQQTENAKYQRDVMMPMQATNLGATTAYQQQQTRNLDYTLQNLMPLDVQSKSLGNLAQGFNNKMLGMDVDNYGFYGTRSQDPRERVASWTVGKTRRIVNWLDNLTHTSWH